MKAYIAAPLFSQAEKDFNLTLDAMIHSLGITTYLPQRDGGEAARLVRQGLDEDAVRRQLFERDTRAVATCGLFVFVLDGRVPDEGACVELGMAYSLGKPCFGLQTDSRRFGGTDSNNLMIDYALGLRISHTVGELGEALLMWLDHPVDPERPALLVADPH